MCVRTGRHVKSLAHPKFRILAKQPNNNKLADDHTFTYNMAYTTNLLKVKIGLLAAKKQEKKGGKVILIFDSDLFIFIHANL